MCHEAVLYLRISTSLARASKVGYDVGVDTFRASPVEPQSFRSIASAKATMASGAHAATPKITVKIPQ
jgi:hypothetical protein